MATPEALISAWGSESLLGLSPFDLQKETAAWSASLAGLLTGVQACVYAGPLALQAIHPHYASKKSVWGGRECVHYGTC